MIGPVTSVPTANRIYVGLTDLATADFSRRKDTVTLVVACTSMLLASQEF